MSYELCSIYILHAFVLLSQKPWQHFNIKPIKNAINRNRCGASMVNSEHHYYAQVHSASLCISTPPVHYVVGEVNVATCSKQLFIVCAESILKSWSPNMLRRNMKQEGLRAHTGHSKLRVQRSLQRTHSRQSPCHCERLMLTLSHWLLVSYLWWHRPHGSRVMTPFAVKHIFWNEFLVEFLVC